MLPENQQIIHPIDKVYKAVTSYLTGNTTNTHQVAVLLLMTAFYLYGRGIRWVIWALHLNQKHLQTNTWQESVTSKYARNKEWLHSKPFFLSVFFFLHLLPTVQVFAEQTVLLRTFLVCFAYVFLWEERNVSRTQLSVTGEPQTFASWEPSKKKKKKLFFFKEGKWAWLLHKEFL